MICKIKQTVEKYGLLNEKIKSVAVGFSGGADSVCLLDVLWSLKDEYGISVKAVHINHNIRGVEADSDEMFVRRFCESRGIELIVHSIDVPFLASQRKISLEECGRQVRYECFEDIGCDAVAVAHTLSDSIETMLFNLARGTGTKGLTGISPKREPNIIRPLISCTRCEIEKYCTDNSLDYVTDSSNLSDDYTRNHIRHNIVPAFAKINSDFEESFMRAMTSVREMDDFVECCAEQLIQVAECDGSYRINMLAEADITVLKKSILKILKSKMNKPPEAKHIDSCVELIKSRKGKIEIAKDLYILADGDIISFSFAEKEVGHWKAFFADGVADTVLGVFRLEDGFQNATDSFDAGKIKNELFISSRLPGDIFTFKKRRISKTLKKLFNEMKIPACKRCSIAVLHDGENVVWIEDIGVNALYIPDENSEKIITIKKDG